MMSVLVCSGPCAQGGRSIPTTFRMIPTIFRPPDVFASPALPRRYKLRGPDAPEKPTGKLILLPQTVLIYSNKNEQLYNDTRKEIAAVARLSSCRYLSNEELQTGVTVQQIRIWQNRKKYQQLSGGYTLWQLEFLHLLKTPIDLAKANPPTSDPNLGPIIYQPSHGTNLTNNGRDGRLRGRQPASTKDG